MQLKHLYKWDFCIELTYLIEHDSLELVNDLYYRMVWNLQTNFDFIEQLLAELFCEHGALTPV